MKLFRMNHAAYMEYTWNQLNYGYKWSRIFPNDKAKISPTLEDFTFGESIAHHTVYRIVLQSGPHQSSFEQTSLKNDVIE